ncbi:MAG: hypothetical protein COV44_10475 [Deltaproteobacteria bacterium CG11_big_fil_rev_8_21_14_0_20_45_16]|nr:MAG: hypothetical protein COV44_10475 [Deltaproteobacteria bacterium CG11_big_fil_rev_8_21_14_0_20_45_16]
MNNLPTIFGDQRKLKMVFENLIGNASRYAIKPGPPELHIDSQANPEGLVITLKDFGPGIPKEHQGQIFEVFRRFDTESEGAGLGLAIVKKIMQLHQGDCWVSSDLGRGSTFFIQFPKKRKITHFNLNFEFNPLVRTRL